MNWTEDRPENFLAAYQGRGVEADLELALEADGRLLGLRAVLYADLGAYLYATPPRAAHDGMLMTGATTIPAVAVESSARQRQGADRALRGAGPARGRASRATVDLAAGELGLDPVALRRRNFVPAFPYETPLGWIYDSGDYGRCLDAALELVGAAEEAAPAEGVSGGVGCTWSGPAAGRAPP